jgi:hypothetical protein
MHYQGDSETSDTNSVEVHPQLTCMGHPVDGALVGAGSLWPCHDSSSHDATGLKNAVLPSEYAFYMCTQG